MAIELNLQGNCTVDLKGTGLDACVAEYGDLTAISLYTKGSFALNIVSDTFPDEAAYKLLIQGESSFPLLDIFNYEQTTPDNTIATSTREIKKEIRSGKPEFSTTWSNGGCWHESVYDKKGTGLWDIALIFGSGVLYGKNTAETILKPFTTGMFSVSTFKLQQGSDPDMTTTVFQFTASNEFNLRKSFKTFVQLGYDMNEIEGVHNTTIENTIPATTATDFSASVKSSCNTSVVITGLDDPNEWKLNGIQASATTISTVTFNAGTQAYDFVVSPILVSSDTIQLSLADVSAGLDVAINAAGDFYKGTAPLVTV